VDAFYTRVADLVASHTGRPASEVREQLTPPKQPEHGDIALPCFKLAQTLGRAGKDAAPALAKELAGMLAGAGPPIVAAEAAGPFLNVRLDPAAIAKDVVDAVLTRPIYGGSDEGADRTIVIDFSSPNIAKPFHLGHLRSTVIGWSLRQIFRALGYTVVGVNHLGDWGTQFGLMMSAWTRWRSEAEARLAKGERDIDVFVDLYVRINTEKKKNPAVAEEGRAWFKKLEAGDAEARRLWRFFVDRSKAEFQRIYDILGIVHESDSGEAFYEDKMPAMVALLERYPGLLVEGRSRLEELEALKQEAADAATKGAAARAELAGATDDKKKKELEKRAKQLESRAAELAKKAKNLEAQLAAPVEDEGEDAGPADRRPRGIVLERKDKPAGFCMLLKGDGGTTYSTRDLTAVRYRSETYKPAQVLYVVGNTQRDHFIPLFEVVDLLAKKGEPWAQGLTLNHIGFGNYLGMSTRGGTAVFLEQVLERARVAAHEAAASAEKKVELSDAQRESVARAIGVGGLKFFDLKGARTNDIDLSKPDGTLDWDRLLSLKGDSGPYLQFAHARLAGILRRLGGPPSGTEVDGRALADAEAQALLKSIAAFPGKVRQAAAEHEPSVIARYLLELSAKIHQFVHARRVLDAAAEGDVPAEAVRRARALLVVAAKKVLAEGLGLLGIEAVEVM
jgi:arginyl-tRNA synthetase